MKTNDKPRATYKEIQCIGTPVNVKDVQVGFAPIPEVPEVTIEALEDVGFSRNTIALLAYRAAANDVRNKVAALYSGKGLSADKKASMVLEAIGTGELTAEDVVEMTRQMNAGTATFSEAGWAILGIGDRALEAAKADEWHWKIMETVVK